MIEYLLTSIWWWENGGAIFRHGLFEFIWAMTNTPFPSHLLFAAGPSSVD